MQYFKADNEVSAVDLTPLGTWSHCKTTRPCAVDSTYTLWSALNYTQVGLSSLVRTIMFLAASAFLVTTVPVELL